jgi:DNA-directed RNA polymerase II subunit RPB2
MNKSRTFIDELDNWCVIKHLLTHQNYKNLIRHHIESYNNFIEVKIPLIIKQLNPLCIYHEYLENTNSYKYEIIINFTDINYIKPTIFENDGSTKTMYPQDARLRNFTYSQTIMVNINIEIVQDPSTANSKTLIVKTLNNINIGKVPVMVNSKYCMLDNKDTNKDEGVYDLGGYFIINGNEKVIVAQEKIAENKIYVFESTKNSKYSHICEIKSVSMVGFNTPKNVSVRLLTRDNSYGRCIRVNIPHVKVDVPLFIIFKALGITSDKEIISYIVHDINREDSSMLNWLRPNVEEASHIKTQEEALEYLLKNGIILGQPKDIKLDKVKKLKIFKGMLGRDFLCHVGEDFNKKALFLGYMVNKLGMCFLNKVKMDDRDNYCNKRIETSGHLMALLFRQYFTKLIKDMRNSIMKELNSGPWKTTKNIEAIINSTNLFKMLKSTTLESGLKYGLSTGNWGIKSTTTRVGIAQVLSRITYVSTISHLRRVNTPTEKTGKLVAPRKLHNTQWGIICAPETPEGGSVGLVKNLALSTYITIDTSKDPIIKVLNNLTNYISLENYINRSEFLLEHLFGKSKIFINGEWVGISNNPIDIYNKLLHYKRVGHINVYTSISFNYEMNQLNIYTDGGRCCRPLYILDNNKLRITKEDINKLYNNTYNINNLLVKSLSNTGHIPNLESKIEEGVIEYVDTEESWNTMIASDFNSLSSKTISYSYCEIHPCLILGVLGSLIPFCNNNQSPRNTYQCAMGKQAMGIYATNFRYRMDTMGHILSYPQKPMVNTRIANYLPTSNMPNGENVIVAIASYTGYNQEDSVILKKSAVERGLFRSTFYRTYKDDEKKYQSSDQEEKFTVPDRELTKGMKPGCYNKLDESGFVKLNEYVGSDDIVIGKVIPLKKTNSRYIYKDASTLLRNNEAGFVDKIYCNRNGEGHKFCKIRIRSERIPKIGDKFSSRHGQKGTVGMIFNDEDMPFTKDGITPDIIINPHAIPSRMTIAQLIECLLGKVCSVIGCYGDGTPFSGIDINDVSAVLKKYKYEEHGNEILYNGFTGTQMSTKIFIGPTYYQRLKHMVEDKIHSRSTGPMVLLTRQPTEGRTREGGLRFGEMERDCMIAHGSLLFLKERMLDISDNYRSFVCNMCGLLGIVNPEKNVYKCKKCNNYSDFSEVRIPYACKLMIQELESMSVAPRIITN